MRDILEKAIVHLLNEEQDKAKALLHEFIVSRAREIHESLRQGDDVELKEGWDDEITSEEYFAEGDLDDTEDGKDLSVDDASDNLGADLDQHEEGSDETTEVPDEDGDTTDDTDVDDTGKGEESEETEERLDNIEDTLDKLTQEFEEMMAKVDDDEAIDTETSNEVEDIDDATTPSEEDVDTNEIEDTDSDNNSDEDLDKDNELTTEEDDFSTFDTDDKELTDVKDGEDDFEDLDNEPEDDVDECGGVFEKASKTIDEELDDITESVMTDLEKVLTSNDSDEEIGNGKKVSVNKTSSLPSKGPADPAVKIGGKPIQQKVETHTGYDREPAPPVKDTGNGLPKAKNRRSNAKVDTSKVPADGDKAALLNKDFAGENSKNTKAVIGGGK